MKTLLRASCGTVLAFVGVQALFVNDLRAQADPIVVEGPKVLVRSTVSHRPAAEKCKEFVEAEIAQLEESLPWKLPPGEKITINLFASKEEYGKAIDSAGVGAFLENQCCTAFSTKESYVVMQPRAETEYLQMVGGLPELTEFLVLHEVVHQFIYRGGAGNYEFWPDWYGEGMADTLAEQSMMKRRAKTKELPVNLEHSRGLVQGLLEKQGDLDLSSLLQLTTFSGGVSRNEAYSAFHSLFRFLASDGKKIRALYEGIGRLGGPAGPAEGMPDNRQQVHGKACIKVLEEVFGPLKALQTRWTTEVKKQPGAWYENFRSSQRAGDDLVCAAFPEGNSILFSVTPAGKGDFAIEGEVNIPGIGGKQADLYIDVERGGDFRFLKIAMGVGQKGFLTMLPYSQNGWQSKLNVNVDIPVDVFAPGAWLPFRLAVKGKTVRFELAKKHSLEFQIPMGFGGSLPKWGLGSTGGVARFRKIKLGK